VLKKRGIERRDSKQADRRKNSRGGRRRGDPRTHWRRIAWLFAAYAMYLSLRSLPDTIRRRFKRAA
jgi:hypothetical protein